MINIQATDSFLMSRLQTLPEKNLKNTHFNEKDMLRRLNIYRKVNNNDNGQPILLNFFNEHKIDVLNVNLEYIEEKAHFDKIEAFVERKGVFKNYQTHEKLKEQKRVENREIAYKEKIEKVKVLNTIMEEKETEKRLLAEEEYKLKIEDFRKMEKNILDSRSLPLRFLFNIFFFFAKNIRIFHLYREIYIYI